MRPSLNEGKWRLRYSSATLGFREVRPTSLLLRPRKRQKNRLVEDSLIERPQGVLAEGSRFQQLTEKPRQVWLPLCLTMAYPYCKVSSRETPRKLILFRDATQRRGCSDNRCSRLSTGHLNLARRSASGLTETDSRVGFGNHTWRIQEDSALAIASGDCELN